MKGQTRLSVDEAIAEVCDAFDAVVVDLGREAEEARARREDAGRRPAEFAPVRAARHFENPAWEQDRLVG